MDVVIDASALAFALLGRSPGAAALRQRLAAERCHSPHLIDAEVGNVLRRRVLGGGIGADDAAELLDAATTLVDFRYEMVGALAAAAWAHHRNLTFYDALYVALAGALRGTLLTGDRRLSRAPGLGCDVELVAAT